MKITDEKISELAEKYAKDNFNNSPTAYYAFKEGMKQAINYTRCCKSDSEQLSKRPNTSSTWECFSKSDKQQKR